MTTQFIETNIDILQHLFTQLRWYILEEKLIMASPNPTEAMAATLRDPPESNPNYNEMMRRLEEPIRFDGSHRKINKQNYYVVKHRLTKYGDDIVENETRAGYMYVLVRKDNYVSVSFLYVHDTQDLSKIAPSKKWAAWDHDDEGWIIYDGDNGHIRGSLSGCLHDN